MGFYVDIKKKLGHFNLDVQLEAKSEIVALLGASGCGKSMTLKCIAGIEKPDSGQIVLDDRVLFDSKKKINLIPQARQVGYLFQNYALFPNMSVEENIAIGMKGPKQEKGSKTAQMIATFYLQGLEKHYPWQISGGQQQRVALARMLAADPQLIMLDEPFSALDSYLKWQLEQELIPMLDQFAGTTLFVSHNRDEVFRICQRIAVLNQGHIDVIGDKWALFHAPETLAASQLTGCKNHSKAKKIGDYQVAAVDWQIVLTTKTLVPDDVAYLGVRAHFLDWPAEGVNQLTYQIEQVIEDTFSMIVMLRNAQSMDHTQNIRWEVDKKKWQQLSQNGLPISLSIAPENIILLTR